MPEEAPTPEQWNALAEAAFELLNYCRTLIWFKALNPDVVPAVEVNCDRLAEALTNVGKPQLTMAEFMARMHSR